MDFKITMAAARVNAGMTQAELADKIGVSRISLMAWEQGKHKPKPIYLRLFCEAVGIPQDYLLLPGELR